MQKYNLKIEVVDINSVVPYGLNNRIHSESQVDSLASSIAEYGFNQPIVVDEKNVVLVGHGRLMAAKKLNLKEIPIYRKTDLTEAQKKAYRIVDNKVASDGSYDFKNLELDIQSLKEMDYDFEPYKLDDLLPDPITDEDLEPEEETPEVDPITDSVSITLVVPLDEKDSFQFDLNDLLKKYHRVIQKGVQRKDINDNEEEF